MKKAKIIGYITIIIISIICILFTIFSIDKIKDNYNLELNKFKQNFIHVDEIGNEYIDKLNDFVNVSNISITELSDNVVSFTARLTMSNDIYGMAISKDSKYILISNSGKVYEYDVFGEHLNYNRYSNMIGKGIREYGDLASVQFFGINKNEISYIKITNLELFKLDTYRITIKNNLELELYKK